jgi:hypothetical protein
MRFFFLHATLLHTLSCHIFPYEAVKSPHTKRENLSSSANLKFERGRRQKFFIVLGAVKRRDRISLSAKSDILTTSHFPHTHKHNHTYMRIVLKFVVFEKCCHENSTDKKRKKEEIDGFILFCFNSHCLFCACCFCSVLI